jgi:hypothetical protein
MRARELRLRQSFQRIVTAVLALPLAGTAGCHSPDVTKEAPLDATIAGEKDADAGADASVADEADATIVDAAACDPIDIDGAYIEPNPDGCIDFRYMPCGLPATAQTSGCNIDIPTCIQGPCKGDVFLYCQLSALSCTDAATIIDGAPTVVECISCNGISGRRPLGLCASRSLRTTAAGDYFAQMAHLEAASVRAFRDLERWLSELGAPSRLVRTARRSAAEERRHARLAANIARRFGGVPRRARVRGVARPSLVALLEDDVVEGCVKESFGALLATWQGRHAADPDVRATLAGIAEDETRHAAFAWEILGWGLRHAKPAERRRIAQTLEKAVAELEVSRPAAVDGAIRTVAGHPSPGDERALARELAALVRREAIDSFGRNATETLKEAAVG